MNQKRRFRRTTIISVGLVWFLVGLFLAKYAYSEFSLIVFVVSIFWLAIFRKRTYITLVLAIVCGLAFGMWRGGIVHKKLLQYKDKFGTTVEVTGKVVDDPVYDKKGLQDFRIGAALINAKSMVGQVRIKAHINGVRRGDKVRVKGRLRDGFGNYQASMYFAKVEIIEPSHSFIETIRREFFAAVYSVLPEPQASLGLGFLVGLHSALPDDFDEQLKIVGLTHIVVASGFNLTILVRLSRRMLSKYSKYQAFAGSIALILAFLAITGASPSMVRASVVTILSLLAWYYGRRFQPVLIILLGAVLTAGFNPLYIWYDLGWWLSFLAFAGVLILAPLLTVRFYGKKSPPLLVQVAVETIAAQVMAMPLIMYTFGSLSLVAVIANISVVPLIPIAMLTTFVAGIAGLVLSGSLAAWLAVPAQLVLSYVVSAVQFFAAPSWAQQLMGVGIITMLALYGVIVTLIIILYRKTKFAFEQIPSVVE